MIEDCHLYLLSPPEIGPDFPEKLRAALEAAPVAAFQLRLKGIDEHAAARLGEPLQKICADLDTAFIVNDSIGLAKRLGADGVHLGQSDGDPREARDVLGRDAQIGVTCHNSRHFAMEAGESGADYVAFGSFYPTGTKVVDKFADTDILTWWSGMFELPCVAIGGINATNGRVLVEAGADFIAVSSAVWSHPDGEAAAVRELAAILPR
jgi:thiamine-phosphate pyrophosphorylase